MTLAYRHQFWNASTKPIGTEKLEHKSEETPIQNYPFNQNLKTCEEILRKPENKNNRV